MTGKTVVTREAEWDDEQRERMLALGIYEAQVCECGFHASLANNPANFFTFETKVCPVCAGVAKFGRRQSDADEKEVKARHGEDDPPPNATLPDDGRRMFVRQMSPDEVARLRQRSAG